MGSGCKIRVHYKFGSFQPLNNMLMLTRDLHRIYGFMCLFWFLQNYLSFISQNAAAAHVFIRSILKVLLKPVQTHNYISELLDHNNVTDRSLFVVPQIEYETAICGYTTVKQDMGLVHIKSVPTPTTFKSNAI